MWIQRYEGYPQGKITRQWDELLKLDRDDVERIVDEWDKIWERNKEKEKELRRMREVKLANVEMSLKEAGVDVFKYGRGIIPQKKGHKAWFKNNVVKKLEEEYPRYNGNKPYVPMGSMEVDGVTISNNQSPIKVLEFYDRAVRQYRRGLEEQKKKDKKVVKSIEYANENDIDIEAMSPKEIVSVVEDWAREQFRDNELPYGEEVWMKHGCDECSTYVMGEHRCSCGNRRIQVLIEGDIVEGFYYDIEPY